MFKSDLSIHYAKLGKIAILTLQKRRYFGLKNEKNDRLGMGSQGLF